jgi:hypothetical protein
MRSIVGCSDRKYADNLPMDGSGVAEHGLRRRIWLGGLGVGLLVLIIVVSQLFGPLTDDSHQLALGGDFLPAYAAGTLVRQGRATDVYQPAAVEQIERKVAADARLAPLPYYGPYLNPPFFAAFYAPFAALPYRAAAMLWLAFNLLGLCAAIILMRRMLAPTDGWRTWGLVPLLLCISMPFWQAICHLQNTCLSLALLCGVVGLWRSPIGNWKAVAAGSLSGLLIYKPQIACLIAVALFVTLGWRALLGFAITTGTLLGLTLWKLPGAMSAYLFKLPTLIRQIQERPQYNWGRQPTPMGFWRLLIQGHSGGPARGTVIIVCGLSIALFAIIWIASVIIYVRNSDPHLAALFEPEPQSRRALAGGVRSLTNSSQHVSLDCLIAITITCMPLLMPYYMDYDLLLLAIPAVLLAKEWMESAQIPRGIDRVLPWAWSGLILILYVNPGLSGASRLNLAAPLLALVAGLMIIRCIRVDCSQIAQRSVERPLKAAA